MALAEASVVTLVPSLQLLTVQGGDLIWIHNAT